MAVGTGEAQRIFYELVMPGKNHFNAVFCVGTNVIFRRAALAEIGADLEKPDRMLRLLQGDVGSGKR